MTAMRPIVALLSDFGHLDHYVGAMKGAVLSACREATVVDIGHDVPAHDVGSGALALASAYTAFPAATVFVAVVDPGVGTQRRGLAAAAGGYYFVGPDNGVLSLALREHAQVEVREITNRGLWRHQVSPVFHGRDVFAPVAGHLAAGAGLDQVGPLVADFLKLTLAPPVRRGPAEWAAEVVHVDRFGNLVTSFLARDLEALTGLPASDWGELQVLVGGSVSPFARTYADVPVGEALALVGSSGRVEVSVNQGDASRALSAGPGTPVILTRTPHDPS
jgi:S-adenosylmethionine hydrolase